MQRLVRVMTPHIFLCFMLTMTSLFPPLAGATSKSEPIKLELSWEGRPVLVFLPEKSQPHSVPLVIALHGGGGSAENFAKSDHNGLIEAAMEHGYAIAFPNGIAKGPRGNWATWNAGGCCGGARDQQINDVAFLTGLVVHLQERFPQLNPKRTYATGMSNGGMMSYKLACDAAHVFKAVASVAGTIATSTCTPSRPTSILHIHAIDDDRVLFEGGAGEKPFRNRNKVMDFTSVAHTMDMWRTINDCRKEEISLLENGITLTSFTECRENTKTSLVTLPSGGHSWPGTTSPRKRNQAIAWPASNAILDFFEATP